ncbi:MFS transporter [Brooklawnia cerclae]|uniref:MFS family permease n=1 Tax=Brooklawnia cerclae TaxID=349934 RepID=A0ABX0SCI8_9ACTN|nr:MFS transporter [Brooklawnia cerclae]NIH56049.1 MFS family permease [Brooklawnia cerclae]
MSAGASQLRAVSLVVLLVYMGQMALNPVIAPLAREVGLAEWQIGLTISVAAVTVVVLSQFWGRFAQTHGARRVLIRAVGLTAVAMIAFFLTAWAGTRGLLGGTILFVLFVVLRGIMFGAGISAVPPTAQTYVASVTTSEPERVKGMAGIGAAQGMAMILGAVVGGALAGLGLLVSIGAVPILLLAAIMVAASLKPEAAPVGLARPARISPFDPRAWPFLVAGFGMFTSLGFIQVISGFLVQDRFHLSSESTGLAAGGALLAAGIGQVLAQVVIVPRSGWSPLTLLRSGGVITLAGFVALLPDAGMGVFVGALFLIGLGLGIATPGYTAGPSLLMRPEEQGGLAGVIGMTNGLTFVLSPSLSTLAYGVAPVLPILISAGLMGIVVAFVLLHPGVRQRPVAEVTGPEALSGEAS